MKDFFKDYEEDHGPWRKPELSKSEWWTVGVIIVASLLVIGISLVH